MVDLSKSEKTKQIVKNLVDMVYAYIDEVSLVGKTIRVVKKGASAISRMASNGAAAIRNSAAAIFGIVGNGTTTIGRGAAAAWEKIVFWRRWQEEEEE